MTIARRRLNLKFNVTGQCQGLGLGLWLARTVNAVGLTLILSRRHFVLLFCNVCRQYTDVCAVVSGARLLSYLELYMSLLHVQPTHCTLSGIYSCNILRYDTIRGAILTCAQKLT